MSKSISYIFINREKSHTGLKAIVFLMTTNIILLHLSNEITNQRVKKLRNEIEELKRMKGE